MFDLGEHVDRLIPEPQTVPGPNTGTKHIAAASGPAQSPPVMPRRRDGRSVPLA